jgi:ribonuclease PH
VGLFSAPTSDNLVGVTLYSTGEAVKSTMASARIKATTIRMASTPFSVLRRADAEAVEGSRARIIYACRWIIAS